MFLCLSLHFCPFAIFFSLFNVFFLCFFFLLFCFLASSTFQFFILLSLSLYNFLFVFFSLWRLLLFPSTIIFYSFFCLLKRLRIICFCFRIFSLFPISKIFWDFVSIFAFFWNVFATYFSSASFFQKIFGGSSEVLWIFFDIHPILRCFSRLMIIIAAPTSSVAR